MSTFSSPPRLPQPSAEAAAHSERLLQLIRAEIQSAGGWIPFDRYMALALYAPALGYYTAGAHKIGDASSGGDFVTAPEISPLFAQALARQVAQVCQASAPQVLEFGAGSGVLAAQLIDSLAQQGLEVNYQIVEVSADLRERQQQRLAGRQVQWLDEPPAQFVGAAIANEVLDVLPVRLFACSQQQVFERGVSVVGDALSFVLRPADSELTQAVRAIEAEVGALPAGYGSEVSPQVSAWAALSAQWLQRGVLFAIDYGFPRREYYHAQRLMGTLMCHYRHHAHADPLWLPGLNDITAHVDFTAVADAAHVAGLQVLGYTTQAHFLINCGLLDLLAAAPSPAANAGVQRLVSEAEMGELFKVIALGRGMDEPLLGFMRGDRLDTL